MTHFLKELSKKIHENPREYTKWLQTKNGLYIRICRDNRKNICENVYDFLENIKKILRIKVFLV